MGYLKRIIHNCKQATYLIEKKSATKITFRERIELRIHLFGCGFCRLFSKQSQMINEMVKELFRSSMQSNPKLDDKFKKDLQETIDTDFTNGNE